jgi:hypothetical protein
MARLQVVDLINTLLQRGGRGRCEGCNCFNSFLHGGQTAEAVRFLARALTTPLKRGVYEIGASHERQGYVRLDESGQAATVGCNNC